MADSLMCMLLLSNEFYFKREVNEVSGRQPGEDVACNMALVVTKGLGGR